MGNTTSVYGESTYEKDKIHSEWPGEKGKTVTHDFDVTKDGDPLKSKGTWTGPDSKTTSSEGQLQVTHKSGE